MNETPQSASAATPASAPMPGAAAERAQLIALCARLGAPPAQAATMADQLLKRCGQLAEERGWTRVRAMQHLLSVVTRGANGEPPPGFEGVRKE
jgi:hypothetical protein